MAAVYTGLDPSGTGFTQPEKLSVYRGTLQKITVFFEEEVGAGLLENDEIGAKL